MTLDNKDYIKVQYFFFGNLVQFKKVQDSVRSKGEIQKMRKDLFPYGRS